VRRSDAAKSKTLWLTRSTFPFMRRGLALRREAIVSGSGLYFEADDGHLPVQLGV
jgi:hypothetical protein